MKEEITPVITAAITRYEAVSPAVTLPALRE